MTNILKNTWAVLDKHEKKRFSFLIVFDLLINLLDILSLALLLWIIQFYIQPGKESNLPYLPGWLSGRKAIWFIAFFFLLFGIKNLLAYSISRSHFRFIGKVAIRVSSQNLQHYQGSGMEEFVNVDSSTHIRRISFQPFEFSQYMLTGIQQLITQSALILLTVLAILLFNAKLFLLLLLILLPPVILVFYFIKKRLTATKKLIQTSNEKSFQYLLDALKGYIESNVYDRNEFFLHRFLDARKIFSKHLFDSLALQTMPGRIIEIFAILGLFILIAIAKWSGHDDSAALLTVGAFLAAAYKIIPGIVKVINISGQMKAYENSIHEVEKVVAAANPPAIDLIEPVQTIKLEGIFFEYGHQPILKNINLEVEAGDFLGLKGKSGIGKTTLFNILLGFLDPSAGKLLVNGKPAAKKDLQQCWPMIAYVRQQPFFIHDTLLRNITLEESGYNHENLNDALIVSGLDQLIAGFPEKLEKIITENGKNISGGQQQRVAIARALYKRAGIILLDEPFNELDEQSTRKMLEHFQELSRQGKIIIMITHDQPSLSYCNKIYSLDE